eukprot:GHVS01001346.1.p1 GENE.GHVS01001346.1~~GHVS01001346.1.p1  ORF type:complete len:157 (+),score=12.56 GHVS01001346.1:118-588(+)
MLILCRIRAGFWNVPLSAESRAATAFLTPDGLFEWAVMPFGLRNAPSEFQRIIDYAMKDCLGSKNGIEVDPSKVEALLHRYLPSMATIAVPITALLKKSTPFSWSAQAQEAFTQLKEELCSAILLTAPKGPGQFIIETDASDIGIGAIRHPNKVEY